MAGKKTNKVIKGSKLGLKQTIGSSKAAFIKNV